MAGTINLSLTQQLDEYGEPLSGGQLYFFQAGTVSTPQDSFQDVALTIKLPWPITLDYAGRIPQFFLADGQIKVRLQDVNGVVKFTADNLLVIGPSSSGGGGGGGSVDPTTVLQTGDVKVRYDTAILTGFVRCNGLTIGSAASGATEMADPSTQALFNFLWHTDTTLVVSPGGRGASSAADWTANKQIALPDFRSRALYGLGGMGNVDNGVFAGVAFLSGSQDILGSKCGAARHISTQLEMPAHYHIAGIYDPGHVHSGSVPFGLASYATTDVTGYRSMQAAATAVTINAATTGVRVTSSNGLDTTYSAGGGAAWDSVSPATFLTIYMKL